MNAMLKRQLTLFQTLVMPLVMLASLAHAELETTQYQYDAAGRLAVVMRRLPGTNVVTYLEHDLAGNLALESAYDAADTEVAVDANGMITGYSGSGGEVTIPDSLIGLPVIGIGPQAFFSCTNLTRITLPASVTNLGDYAFYNCTSLTGVYFKGNAPSAGLGVFNGASNATVYYLAGTTGWPVVPGAWAGRPTALWNLSARPELIQSPTSVLVRPGQTAQFQVQASGNEPLRYRWTKNGQPVAGASNAVYILRNITAAQAGKYQVLVSNALGSTNSAVATLTVDGVKPTLTVTTPPANSKVTTAATNLSGRVTDTGGPLANVLYQVNNGAWQTAMGTTNWVAPVNNLVRGPNTINLCAADVAGNWSATNMLKVTYVVSDWLTVLPPSHGSIAPDLNGKLYEIDKVISTRLAATPAKGWLLSNWVAQIGVGGPVLWTSNQAAIQVTMVSNLVLTANFVTNQWLAFKGEYVGLFMPTNGTPDFTNAGQLKLTVTDKGTFTGQLLYKGLTVALTDGFDASGCVRRTNLAGRASVVVALQVDFAAQAVRGTVREGSDWIAPAVAYRKTTSATKANYTLVLASAAPPMPAGYGAATVVVNAAGTVSLAGNLGDGTVLNVTPAVVDAAGYWPVYLALYGNQGMVLGWLNATNAERDGNRLYWQKPASGTGVHRAGFGGVLEATLTPYNMPAGNRTAPGWTNGASGMLWVEGGNVPTNMMWQVPIQISNNLAKAMGGTLTK
ncbi:MAG: leucine-rich repeat protein [Verrucomicrobiota bacterium]